MENKMLKIVFTVTCFICSLIISSAQTKNLAGKWGGELNVQNTSLRIHFNLTKVGTGFVGTMDSPDQNVGGINLSEISFDGNNFSLKVPQIMGEYKGVLISNDSISGKWSQMGNSYQLELNRLRINRPQNPQPPYNYKIEEVKFENKKENSKLAGTLTYPDKDRKYPAVVLVSGSGLQDRDETIMDHKPFWVIADYLTKKGIAVLRYDDRGAGESKGPMDNLTTFSFASDAEAAIEFLKSNKNIDKSKIGIIGHSEGAMIATILASERDDISFAVLLAGSAVKGSDLMIEQNRMQFAAMGIDKNLTNKYCDFLKTLFNNQDKSEELSVKINKGLENFSKEEKIQLNIKTGYTEILSSQLQNSWFDTFLKIDPAEYLYNISIPMLILTGEKDLQVSAEQNIPAFTEALEIAGNDKSEIVNVENVNHLFQNCDKGTVVEYGSIEETISPKVLDLVEKWIDKQIRSIK